MNVKCLEYFYFSLDFYESIYLTMRVCDFAFYVTPRTSFKKKQVVLHIEHQGFVLSICGCSGHRRGLCRFDCLDRWYTRLAGLD